MTRFRRFVVAAAIAGAAAAAGTQPLHAQQPGFHQQVISANPFGLLLEVFNAEYERIVTESSTAGFGGSTFSAEDLRYVNADAFWRFYPSGRPLDGWAFGAKVGVTRLSDAGTHFGYGFDVNRSWLLGQNDNFYVGIGFGLKRLVGVSDDSDAWSYIPTFRLVNIGIAF
jgi:hypothetical protein